MQLVEVLIESGLGGHILLQVLNIFFKLYKNSLKIL